MRALLILLVTLLWSVVPLLAQDQPAPLPPDPLATLQRRATLQQLHGHWHSAIGEQRLELILHPDFRFELGQLGGQYQVADNRISLDSAGGRFEYRFKLDAGQLTLEADGVAPVVFMRRTALRGYLARYLDISWPEAVRTFNRIGLILLVAVFCRVIVMLVRVISQWMLFSRRGATRFLTAKQRNRAMTIHALVLNIIKYVVYFTALGFVLNELGINTTTYLASLSVIGLAIGFGSQGLVQDMVTGFFIIFEGQFDVGDMVEISGQVGLVEDLGLRMTKLRNFVGQVVVIPNRNIAIVANYSAGSLVATVEMAVAESARLDAAGQTLLQVAGEVQRQFPGVIVQSPQLDAPLTLQTGEQFARLRLGIWPAQQWVVDGQLLPRLREAMQRAQLAIAADRIVVHYDPPRQTAISDWRDAINLLQRLRRSDQATP